MRLAHPELLWLLLLAPLVVLGFSLSHARRQRALERLGEHPVIARMMATVSTPRKVARVALLVLGLVLVVLGLSRPQAGGRARLEKSKGLDIVVALDFSKSMLAKDIYPSRLERAKRELERLLDQLAGDRVGLVAFAGETLSYPPSTDYDALKLFWRDLSPADMPVGGTAIGRALRAGIDMLTRLRVHQGGATRDQVILLLTDGEDTESKPLEMADEAAKLGIKIFAVGIGSRSGELIPEPGADNQPGGFLKDKDGKYVTSRIDEGLLTQLAQKTGGGYLRADGKQFGVEAVTATLMGLKRTASESKLVKHYDEAFEFLLFPAFLLLAVEICLSDRRRRPAGAALVFFLALPFLGAWNPLERPNPAVEDGNTALKAGKADEALSRYDAALSKGNANPAIHFNRGNALYSLSRFDEAAQEFLHATAASDPRLKSAAFYNLGNSHFKLNKYDEAIPAYTHALSLDPANQRAKWNLELALQKKKEADEKKKQDDKKNQDNKDKKNQDNKDKQDKQKQDQQKQDQQKQDQQKQDQQKQDQQKQDQQKQDEQKQDEQKQDEQKQDEQKQNQPKPDQAETPKEEKAQQLREIDAVLNQLEKSPKDLEKMRARLRAVRRAPPAKDW
jgi:Ca-activated chloride channel family protein